MQKSYKMDSRRNWRAAIRSIHSTPHCGSRHMHIKTQTQRLRSLRSTAGITFFTALGSLCLAFSSLYAKPFVEKAERAEIDWGNLKVRFFGESTPGEVESEQASFADIEKNAWTEGLLQIRSTISAFHQKQLSAQRGVDKVLAEQSGLAAGDRIASTTYSYKQEYFSKGGVRVHLENSLARALQRQDLLFKRREAPSIPAGGFSGLVLRASVAVPPQAHYTLVDETGRVLFTAEDVAQEAYEKNLMGRWFINPDRGELTKVVGPKPVSLSVTPDGKGNFVVQGAAWQEALQDCQPLLSNARIVIALPE